MSEVREHVRGIMVEKLGIDEKLITDESRFTDDLGADSLAVVELAMEFEKEFDISIPDEVAARISTVGEAIDYLATHTGD